MAVKKSVKKRARGPARKKASVTAPSAHDPYDLEDKDARIDALIHSVNTAGTKYIARASESPDTYFLRRPTGIMELDIDLAGGFPAGGCCFIGGGDNSGKTLLVLKVMAMQQRLYGDNCRLAYAVTEGTFPYGQAIKAGMRVYLPDRLIEQQQEWLRIRKLPLLTSEEVARSQCPSVDKQLVILRGYTGEEVLTTMLEAVKTRAFSVIACDSLNGLQPAANAEKDMDEHEKMAAHANMFGRFLKKYIPLTTGLNKTNYTSVLFTQQVRSNPEKAEASSFMRKYVDSTIPAGGGAAGSHYKLIGLRLYSRKVLKNTAGVIGKMIGWKLDKGKANTHDNLSGDVAFYYARTGGVDEVGELMAAAIKRGVIQQDGKKVIVVRPEDGVVLDEFTSATQKALRKILEIDPELEMSLRREVLGQAGISCLYV